MQISPTNLTFLFNAWNLQFQSGYKSTTPWWSKICTKKTSTTEQESYAWASRVAQLREWFGERQMRSVGTYVQTIINRDFESTVEVDRNKILDDTYGVYDFPMRDLGRAAAKWPDVMALSVFLNGQTQSCYDGQTFFSASHPIDLYGGQISTSLAVQSNYFTGTPLTFDNYLAARANMMQFKGEDGLPFGVVPDTLFVPPQLETVGKLICEAASVAPQTLNGITQVGANDNVLQGTAKVVVIPELGVDAGGWYLADTSKGIMPFVFQERQAPNIITLRDPGSENVFKRKKFAFGADVRGNAFGGLWWLMSKAHS